jgi:NADPH-dependent ferric siderophore reductase
LLRGDSTARWHLPLQAQWEVTQLTDGDALLAALRSWQVPDGHGFAWCAGEGADAPGAHGIAGRKQCRAKA